jgi:hypothetical protein
VRNGLIPLFESPDHRFPFGLLRRGGATGCGNEQNGAPHLADRGSQAALPRLGHVQSEKVNSAFSLPMGTERHCVGNNNCSNCLNKESDSGRPERLRNAATSGRQEMILSRKALLFVTGRTGQRGAGMQIESKKPDPRKAPDRKTPHLKV